MGRVRGIGLGLVAALVAEPAFAAELDGRRLHTLAVKAGNGCSPSPHLSSESGWKWNSRLAVA